MGILDAVSGAAGGGLDLGTLAARVGLSEEQVKTGLAALAQALHEHGDTVTLAAQKMGLPLDKLQGLLAAVGGEAALGAGGSLLGGGAGLAGALGGMLGR